MVRPQQAYIEADLGLTVVEVKVMDIILSVIAVIVALSCLVSLLISDIKDYIKPATVNRQLSNVKNAEGQ
jgi:hypothetical protein